MSVKIERDGTIAIVRLDRPDKHNAVNLALLDGVARAARELRRDRALRGVLLLGNGPSFCAGIDIKGILQESSRLAVLLQLLAPWANRFQRFGMEWRRLPVPVVACVHGACFGAGIQLALGADFRIASPDARFSIMESKWGLVPDMSGAVTLRGLLREDTLKELAMTGRILDADQARELGLVGRVVDDPEAAARELLAEIAVRSPDAVAATKSLFQKTRTAGPWRTLLAERLTQLRIIGRRNQQIAVANNLTDVKRPYGPRRYG